MSVGLQNLLAEVRILSSSLGLADCCAGLIIDNSRACRVTGERHLSGFGVWGNGRPLGLGPSPRRFDSCHSDGGRAVPAQHSPAHPGGASADGRTSVLQTEGRGSNPRRRTMPSPPMQCRPCTGIWVGFDSDRGPQLVKLTWQSTALVKRRQRVRLSPSALKVSLVRRRFRVQLSVEAPRGRDVLAACDLAKVVERVRFPSSAPSA